MKFEVLGEGSFLVLSGDIRTGFVQIAVIMFFSCKGAISSWIVFGHFC